MRHFIVAALLIHAVAAPATTRGQSPLDRIVGPAPDGSDLVIRYFGPAWDAGWVGDLSHAAGVAMGLEVSTASPTQPLPPLKVTGLTLERALRLLHERDPRYEWRDDDGVIVLRPAESRVDDASPLQLPAMAVRSEQVTIRHAFALVCGLLGAPPESHQSFSDAKPLSLNFAGGRVVDLLNAIVRSHGGLSWSFARAAQPTEVAAFFVGFSEPAQTQGRRCGVPGVLTSVATNPFVRGLSIADRPSVLIDRVVGLLAYKRRVRVLEGFMPVDELFRATMVPFGFERGPAPKAACGAPGYSCGNARSAVLSGLTLGKALDSLIDLTPGYEWREMNGIVVIRPVSAWSDSDHPLYKPFAGVKLDHVSTNDVVRTLATVVGSATPPRLGDSKPLSLDVSPGTILDLLNAIVIAHGQLMWTFEPVSEPRTGGPRYVINFWGPGVQVASLTVP